MKKFLFVMIAALGMSMVSCGGHRTEENTEVATSDSVIEVVDTVAVDTVAVEAPTDSLVAE